jgi:hypothetical protein
VHGVEWDYTETLGFVPAARVIFAFIRHLAVDICVEGKPIRCCSKEAENLHRISKMGF